MSNDNMIMDTKAPQDRFQAAEVSTSVSYRKLQSLIQWVEAPANAGHLCTGSSL